MRANSEGGGRQRLDMTLAAPDIAAIRLLMVWRREPDGRWRIARELLDEEP